MELPIFRKATGELLDWALKDVDGQVILIQENAIGDSVSHLHPKL